MNNPILNIITCENCFNIPKILFIKKNKIEIECPKCKTKEIKDICYFEKFINKLEDKNFIDMPNCSYNEAHAINAKKYCFQCSKYLCEQCLSNHDIAFKGKTHILISQKVENNYYCNKEGHTEFIYNQYCPECKSYLCQMCKCENKNESIYNFDDLENKQKINEIILKVKKCKK